MTELEKIEKLCEKANVTYEEARAVLEECSWDLLDAVVLLEKRGKLRGNSARHSTRQESSASQEEDEEEPSRFAERLGTVGKQIRRLVEIGNNNDFVISRREKQIISLPITVMVLLLILSLSTVLILLVIGLFCGLRYSIRGPQLGKPAVNNVMDKAANAAENVRETVSDSFRSGK